MGPGNLGGLSAEKIADADWYFDRAPGGKIERIECGKLLPIGDAPVVGRMSERLRGGKHQQSTGDCPLPRHFASNRKTFVQDCDLSNTTGPFELAFVLRPQHFVSETQSTF